jgi:inosine-uridine nucleoside N-ribohydrolase/formylmethanofuran dehydrogenase subunit E
MKNRRAVAGMLAGVFGLAAGMFTELAPASARAHSGPPVIVDTDMAADDARALALLLNCPYVNVLAVVTSDGASPPDVGATNVCRMLGFLKQEGVAVGIGRSLAAPAPAFRTNATGLDWAKLGEPVVPLGGLFSATNLIHFALRNSPSGVVYICLGPLTNLGEALKDTPELAGAISSVLWFGTLPNAPQPDWNATRDETALKQIAAAGLRVEAIHWPDEASAPVVDDALLDGLVALESPAAELVLWLHSSGRGAELVRAKHLRLWDDLVVLRFLDSSLGTLSPVAGQAGWSELTAVDAAAVRRAFSAKLRLFPSRATVIMADFPTVPQQLLPDVREWAAQIITRYGLEEWKAAVLTSELHRHLGTYSIVGAKMGLRARERFNVALDELHVESQAGLKPPLSCVNDGLQVATGASLGRGTITVVTNRPPACEAVFSYAERRVRLRLKPEFAKQIAADMAALVKRYGGTTPEYFQAVRGVSLKHWLNFDRATMFEETVEGGQATP